MLSAAKEKDFGLNRLVVIKDSTLLPMLSAAIVFDLTRFDVFEPNPELMVLIYQKLSDVIRG